MSQAIFSIQTSVDTKQFLRDVVQGLSQLKKTLPCKYFYNEIGSYYFERICSSEDYYITRCELSIMHQYTAQIAQLAGPHCLLVEYGSGASVKTRLLLDNLVNPSAYIPVDICSEYLESTMAMLNNTYPTLEVLPVCADFTKPFHIPEPFNPYLRKIIYFPGSTIGNFGPSQASQLLRQMRSLCSPSDLVLLGVDLKKEPRILNRAYNDREGFTATFNYNLLQRINEELGANFIVENFRHKAFYNDDEGRVEMHLISTCHQMVNINTHSFLFAEGESIQTESSYKYDLNGIEQLTKSANFRIDQIWTDPDRYFAMILLA